MNIPVVFEDRWFLIVNKPAGLLSVPTPKNEGRTLTGILNQDAKEKNSGYNLYPCHRLDRQTSGLLIYAKSRDIEERMSDAFRNRKVSKKYIAFVHGKMPASQGTLNSRIEGKSAVTKYRILERKAGYSIVEIMPLTGRTNQIRIHFKNIQHPLVGEDKFAFRKDFALRAKRLMLHAGYLEFKHPFTGGIVSVQAELPQDMLKFLEGHKTQE